MLVLTTEQVTLQVTRRSLNRICLWKRSMGHWHVMKDPAMAEPKNGFPLLRMCWLLLAV